MKKKLITPNSKVLNVLYDIMKCKYFVKSYANKNVIVNMLFIFQFKIVFIP